MSENGENRPHVLLLTGTPGIGKTTVIRRAADRLKDKGLRGFYTEEIREKGERRGFRLVSFEGTTQTIAHVDFPKRHRVASTALTSRRSTLRQPCYGPTPKRACTSSSWQDGVSFRTLRCRRAHLNIRLHPGCRDHRRPGRRLYR